MRRARANSMRARAVELGLGGGEEGLAEAERHRAGDDGQPQVEQRAPSRHRPADEPARSARRTSSRRLGRAAAR